MSEIACFLISPSRFAQESLRRLCLDENKKCPSPRSFHDAEVDLGTVEWASDLLGQSLFPDEAMKQDPRWPLACQCGYRFAPEDIWYHCHERLFEKPGQSGLFIVRNAPVGAMWVMDWMPSPWTGPDGLALAVKLPDGVEWYIDGPSRGGGKWTRTGVPPNLTVTPSILSPGYHGFLTGGILRSC